MASTDNLKAPAIDVQVNGIRTKPNAPGNLVGEALSSLYQGMIQVVNVLKALQLELQGFTSGSIVVPDTYTNVPYAASWTPDFGQARRFKMTLTGNLTINAPLNVDDGVEYEIMLIQDATGGRFVTFNSAYKLALGMSASTQILTVTNWVWRADGPALRCTSYTANKPV